MIVKDEEEHIARCLTSIMPLADEIIIVDTGSSDQTIEIINEVCPWADVIHEEWQNDFALHRNTARKKATCKWIASVDADEQLIQTDVEEARHHLEHNDALPDVCLVREILSYPGREITVLQPRLTRREAGIMYVFPIHEQLDVGSVDATLSSLVFLHHGYATPEEQVRKEQRNLAIARQMDDHPHALHSRARSAMRLEMWDEVLENCTKLLETDAGPIVKVETCVLGAAAAYCLSKVAELEEFLEKGKEIAPHAPDIRFIELIVAASKYLATLDDGDSFSPGDFMRPWMFWHNKSQVQGIVDQLLGRYGGVPGQGPGSRAAEAPPRAALTMMDDDGLEMQSAMQLFEDNQAPTVREGARQQERPGCGRGVGIAEDIVTMSHTHTHRHTGHGEAKSNIGTEVEDGNKH